MDIETHEGTAEPLTADMLVEQPKLAVDKLPVLHTIFERLGTYCTDGLKGLCSSPSTFFVNMVDNGNSWDVLESYDDSLAAVFYSPEWDSRIVIGLDRRLVFALMEALYGGAGTEATFEGERHFSTLEQRVARAVAEVAATSLKAAFSIVLEASFKFERLESRIDFSMLGERNIPVIQSQLLFQVVDQGGRMYIILPQSALAPLKENLMRERALEVVNKDPRWLKQMQNGIASTEITVQATLEGRSVALDELAQFEVGDIFPLRPITSTRVLIECGDEKLFRCTLAQAAGNFTLVVEAELDQREEFMGDILGTNATADSSMDA